jgi:glutamate-ammonia-ligase adenylyltransferase
MASYGAGIEIDLRLRPWGKKGALALTPRGYIDYFKADAETWERQAALKARFIAGNRSLGRRAERIFRAVSCSALPDKDRSDEIVAMKRRIESERLKPSERETDIKLGHGGLSDIEWLVQKLQMEHAGRIDALCCSSTIEALDRLGAAGVIEVDVARRLSDTYQHLTRIRNGIWLFTGQSIDVASDPVHLRVVAGRLGYADTGAATAEEQLRAELGSRMSEVRDLFNTLFYGCGVPN